MGNFVEFSLAIQRKFESMTKDASILFETGVDKDEMWGLYMDSYTPDANPIFRKRPVHDCSCCRHFIKQIGNVVSLKNGEVTSIWDIKIDNPYYQRVAYNLSAYVKSHPIANCYHAVSKAVGTSYNYDTSSNEAIRFDHFYLSIPDKFIDRERLSDGDYKGRFHSTRDVFKRSLDEITEDSVQTVLELISQNSLYRGTEWKVPLNKFLQHKRLYDKLPDETAKGLYAWDKHIVFVKQAEYTAIREAADKKARKQHILEIIDKKKDDALQSMSMEELQRLAENL